MRISERNSEQTSFGKFAKLSGKERTPSRRARLLSTATATAIVVAALSHASPTRAAQLYLPVLAGPVVGGVAGIPLNLSGFMDIIPGPSMAIVAAEVTGFQTVGGDGSGGGAGLGGALFVGTGAFVNITSSRFVNNMAIGGDGGTGSIYGGSLNGGGIPSGPLGITSDIPGIPGLPGITPYGQSDQYAFGDGNGNGLDGTDGIRGITPGISPVLAPFIQGGQGGAGGQGQNGWVTNPVRLQAVTDATQNLSIASQNAAIAATQQGISIAQQTISIMLQTADAINTAADAAELAGAIVNLANPFDTGSSALTVATLTIAIGTNATIIAADALQITNDALQLANDAAVIASEGQNVALASQQVAQASQSLSSWLAGQAAGIYAQGGDGGRGGQGGAGGFGASGGAGGDGGRGGLGFSPLSSEANGGRGGNAGISGFGAGGAQGGNGGYAGLLGITGADRGDAGAGGIAGFGGGVGSSGTGLGVDLPVGGGGGSGLGGAIFVQTGGTVLINGISTFMGNSAVAGVSRNGGASGKAAGNSIFLQGMASLIFGALPTDVTTFIGPQSIADNSAIGIGGYGDGTVTVASGTLVMAPGTSNQYAGSTTVGSILNPLSIPGYLSAVLRANDGDGLPQASKLVFTNAGILQTNQSFNRFVGTNPGNVEWTGSGGFAYWNGVVTGDGSVPSAVPGDLNVTLSGNQPLFWGAFGFVPVGSALVFGAKDATGSVTFTNNILTGFAGPLPLTTVNIVVVRNEAQSNVLEPGLSIAENIDYLKYTGSIIGLGGVSFNDLVNDGTIYLLAQNYYVGPTFLNNGDLILQRNGSISPTMLLNITNSNALFDITATTSGTSVGGLAGVGTVRIGDKPFAVTAGLGPILADFGGTIEGTATFDVRGGYQRLSGLNTYTGITTIHDLAALGLAGTGSILASVGVVNNGLLDISATTAGASIQTMSGHGLVGLGNQYLTLVNANDTFSGAIDGTGGIVIAGGTETLTGVNTYSGNTDIQLGTHLILQGAGEIGNSNSVRVDGTFDMTAAQDGASLVSLTGQGSVLIGDRTLTLSNAHDRFNGVVSGSGNVSVTGGAQAFGTVQTYTGQTSISAGANLYLVDAGAIADSAGVANDGLFDIVDTVAGARIKTLSGAGQVNLGNQNLSLTDAKDRFSGAITGSGTLTVLVGNETLSGQNTYTGVTTITQGASLALADSGSIATSAGIVAEGQFNISATTNGASITTLSGAGTVDLGNQTLTLTAANDTFTGVIAAPLGGALVVAAGSETLTGVNTYSGETTVAAGAGLFLTNGGSISDSSRVTVQGLFDISAVTTGTDIISLNGSGVVNLGAHTLTVTAGDDEFGGVLGGLGGLTVSGGRQALSGLNLFAGSAQIDLGATLALSGAGSLVYAAGVIDNGTFDITNASSNVSIETLSGSGAVQLGANRLILNNAAGTFSGAMSGSGGLTVLQGVETLSGVSTYTGGTLVDHAEISANSEAALGDVSGTLTLHDAKLTVAQSFDTSRNLVLEDVGGSIDTKAHTLGLSGTVSGAGLLLADGGGRITLTGSNTYQGGTTIINQTVVAINSDAALGALTGDVRILNGQLLLIGDLASDRAFYIGATSTINADGNGVELSGPIYLETQNWGQLFSGSTQVSGGAWNLTGTQLTLGSDTTLNGVGTVDTNANVNGALQPGNSPGTLVFTQDLTLGSTANFLVNIDVTETGTGAGSYSRVLVGGSFTAAGLLSPILRGITGDANNTFTPQIGQSFVIAASEGAVLGSFAGMVQPTEGLLAGTRLDALYSPHALTLFAVPTDYTALETLGVPLTVNQTSTAASLNAMRPVPGVRANAAITEALGQIYGLTTRQIPDQLTHLAATGYGDALQVAADASRRNGNLIEEQMAVRRAGAAAPGAKLTKVGDLTYWASVQDGRYKADNFGQTRFESDRTGLVAGVDKPMFDGNIAGVAVGYSADRVRSPELGSAIDTDLITVAGYYAWTSGPVYIDSRAGLSRAHYSSERSQYAINQSAAGSGSGWGLNGSSTIGYRYDAGGLQLLPETGLQVDIISRGGLTENRGGATALAVDGETISSVRSKLGVRIEGSTRLSDGYSLTMALRGHWMYEMGNQDVTTNAAFVEARRAKMHVLSVAGDRSSGLVGGGLNLSMPNNMSLWAHYNAELAGDVSSQGASLGLRWAW